MLKKMLFAILSIALTLTVAACSGCSSLPAEQDKVAAACDVAATSLQAVTAATKAGKVSKADLQKAVDIYDAAVIPYCQPIAPSLSKPDWAKLEDAMWKLAVLKPKESS